MDKQESKKELAEIAAQLRDFEPKIRQLDVTADFEH